MVIFKLQTMKTAMQIAIESYKNDGVSFTDWFSNNYEFLLEKEKEQILEAYGRSIMMFYESEQPLEYYNETYNKHKLTIKTNDKVGLSNPDETTINKLNINQNK